MEFISRIKNDGLSVVEVNCKPTNNMTILKKLSITYNTYLATDGMSCYVVKIK